MEGSKNMEQLVKAKIKVNFEGKIDFLIRIGDKKRV